jgi:hypothetical protein
MIGKRAKILSPDHVEDLLVFARQTRLSHPQPSFGATVGNQAPDCTEKYERENG